jgi:hypothetical protein
LGWREVEDEMRRLFAGLVALVWLAGLLVNIETMSFFLGQMSGTTGAGIVAFKFIAIPLSAVSAVAAYALLAEDRR